VHRTQIVDSSSPSKLGASCSCRRTCDEPHHSGRRPPVHTNIRYEKSAATPMLHVTISYALVGEQAAGRDFNVLACISICQQWQCSRIVQHAMSGSACSCEHRRCISDINSRYRSAVAGVCGAEHAFTHVQACILGCNQCKV
jgi:hypothetical protein